jgi:uncharacterized repeat protein (TIGR03803 family)
LVDKGVDRYGNLNGTTFYGGRTDQGTVFILSPKGSVWTEMVIHSFNGSKGDGFYPATGLVVDDAQNLIGATGNGGRYNNGAIFELSRRPLAWTESVIHSFTVADGSVPVGDRLAIGTAGNLYGATEFGGVADYGAVFQLVPTPAGWEYTLLYSFCSIDIVNCQQDDPRNPRGGVILDADGNVYGTTSVSGTAFMLAR